MGRGRWRGGATGRGEMGRGDGDGGNGMGEMGKGATKGEMGKLAKGRGRRRGKRRADFTYEMLGWTYGMPGWNEVTDCFDFVYPCNAGYPS